MSSRRSGTSIVASSASYDFVKRAFDLGAALALFVLLSPVMVLIAAAIKLDSPGPVLYLGRRIGWHGQPFYIFKFRTMRPDAEAEGTTTAKADPRVTRIGWFLRTYKLDELPQLFNVIRGEMSFVGPRPEVEEHTSAYDARERAILDIKPGITDYSSVQFFNLQDVVGAENAHEVFVTRVRARKNALRLQYVERRSFSEDMRILGLTVVAVCRAILKRGA